MVIQQYYIIHNINQT